MLPSVVATQLQFTIRDYLRTTFSLRDKDYEQALLKYLSDPETGMFRGPFVNLRLPFRKGSGAEAPLDIKPPYDPYAHQLCAWERLGSKVDKPRSTLVATGTGSGKTECFLFPLLDHCWRHRDKKGIKAIILYPMNALASDQAERFAKEIHNWPGHGDPQLRGKISAGLYVGGKGSHPKPDERNLVDMREHLRNDPPDILLTNYRMLDFLLLRPEDGSLWKHNTNPKTLQYLVLDELHTYDGAQGTDVAFLIRRLKRRLQIDKGHLCCVGTSATIGGEGLEGRRALTTFASDVFDEEFDDESIIAEDQLGIAEAFPELPDVELPDGTVAATEILDPERYSAPHEYLHSQALIWLGPAPESLQGRWAGPVADGEELNETRALAMGRALARHQFLRDLLTALGSRGISGPRDWREIVAALPEKENKDLRERSNEEQWLVLSSFLALVAHARNKQGDRVGKFLDLQLQLWMRELRRLLRKVPNTEDEPATFAWHDTVEQHEYARFGAQVYCRECGDAGFGMLKLEGKDELVHAPDRVGLGFFQLADTCRYVRVGGGPFDEGQDGEGELYQHYLCPTTLHLGYETAARAKRWTEDGDEPINPIKVSIHGELTEENHKFRRRCPACGSDEALSIMGSRAASLSSVAISHLYISPFNDEPKLLAFTDSVQDASHRAGFFAGRTFRFVLRTAMQTVLEAGGDEVTMEVFVDRLLALWRERLEGEDPQAVGRLAATLLPPDLRDDPDYQAFIAAIGDPKKKPTKKQHRAVDAILRKRLAWEIAREFGLGLVIGRSLDRTVCATATPEPDGLRRAAQALHSTLHERRPVAMKGAGPSVEAVEHFLEGLVERLRARGGIHNPLLDAYVRRGKKFFLSRRKNPHLSRFGPQSRYPLFAFHGKQHKVFEPISAAHTRQTWFRDWTARSLQLETRDAGINDVLSEALRHLNNAGLVESRETDGPAKSNPRASGLLPSALIITRDVEVVGCGRCGMSRTVATRATERWVGRSCTTYRCSGEYIRADASEQRDSYYRRIFRSGQIHRVFAAEHTGMLERTAREALERDFKGGARPDAPNLLTCTPTLEMGIDIGDLSAVMLCSVPPLPANYVQRVGRAGRSTGNALVLTIANARPHDRYFYEQPDQMMRGHIDPPACFLDAPEMLERQLVAHALDCWARDSKSERIPKDMSSLLGKANADGFPHSFYKYYDKKRFVIAGDFFEAYERDADLNPGWTEIKRGLERAIERREIPARIKSAFDGVENERASLRKRREALNKRKAALADDPGLAVPHEDEPNKSADHEIADIDEALKAYDRQLRGLSEKYPLNVLTDEGVLPNYAFPEPGVTLRATLLGLREPDDERGEAKSKKKPRRQKAEYLRPAHAAIREFAPFNSFYAEGRKIEITQLDLGSRQAPTIEKWRFCASCNHCELDIEEHPAPCCPACGDEQWKDKGQLRDLIEFRKAWSTTSVMEASTADESDERDQQSYRLIELIEEEEGSQRGEARLIEEGDVVFGYELMPKAILREINFGRIRDASTVTKLAGHDLEQQGFLVCHGCGRVQNAHAEAKPAHLPWCKTRTSGAEAKYAQVALYRQVKSEAIKLLLPVADYQVAQVVNSFRAALELGFRRKFGGQPMHLNVTTMSEPSGETRKQFLVIYDTVPGGTGYLAELWRQGQLFEVMRLAVDEMKRCRCVGDSSRDGCYRCVYAHQHQRELSTISRARAVEVFESVLKHRAKATTVPSLSAVNLDSLLESELERRFVSALRTACERRGWRWKSIAYQGAQAFRIQVSDELAWDVRPQVRIGDADGVSQWSEADFVLVPIGRETRKVAVFTDGFRYHVTPHKSPATLATDVRKRRAILNVSGSYAPSDKHWVWSLTWSDIEKNLEGGPGVNALLGKTDARSFKKFSDMLNVGRETPTSHDREHGARESFELLIRWLADPDPVRFNDDLVALGLSDLEVKSRYEAGEVEAIAQTLRSPPAVETPELSPSPSGTQLARVRSFGHTHLLSSISLAALRKDHLDLGQLRFILRISDDQAQRQEDGFEAHWRSFLQAWNLLQFHDVEVVSTEALAYDGDAVSDVEEAQQAENEAAGPPDDIRAELFELIEAFRRDGEALRPLFRELTSRQLPTPEEPTEDLMLGGREADVSLVWEEARVALHFGLDDWDRENFRKHKWLAFDPATDDHNAIASAVAQRS